MKRILIGQLGSYGDCLIATTIASQIKHDNPGCHLTWAIGSHYARILENNPCIDYIWEYPIVSRWEVTSKWYQFAQEAQQMKLDGKFDEVYLTQVYPGFPERFYDSLRESMFRGYGKITVPVEMTLGLTMEEIVNVNEFAKLHNLFDRTNVILFEYSPDSGQSFVTTEFALKVSSMVVQNIADTCVILSGSKPIETGNPCIIDGSVLTVREMAELTEYCTLFIGTGSGLSQVVQTTWAKKLPMIQLLKKGTVASVIWDRKRQNLPTRDIIEISTCDEVKVYGCVTATTIGWDLARQIYCEEITPDFTIIRFHMRFDKAKREGNYLGILSAFAIVLRDYGFSMGLLHFFYTFPESIWKLITRKMKGIN